MNTEELRAYDFLRPVAAPGGIKMRPLSSGSFALLRRTGNLFFKPLEAPGRTAAAASPDDQDHLSAALEYAYIHGAPLDAVLRAAHSSPDVFRAEVFRFSETIPLSSIPEIIREVEQGITAAASQSVEVIPRPGAEDRDSPPNS